MHWGRGRGRVATMEDVEMKFKWISWARRFRELAKSSTDIQRREK